MNKKNHSRVKEHELKELKCSSGRNKEQDNSFAERYYKMFQYSPIAIWEEDFSEVKHSFDNLRKGGIRDFRQYFEKHPAEVLDLVHKVKIVEVNDAALKMYKAGSQEDLCKGLSHVFNKESYDVFKAEIIALSEGKTEFQSEAVNLTIKGERRNILLKLVVSPGCEDTLSHVFVYVVDITDLKRMEEELIESEEKYRTIVETAHDAMLIVDAETGIILDANKKAGELIGMPAGDIVGMHCTQLHPEDEEDYHRKKYKNHVNSGSFVSEKEILCRSNGDRVPVSISSSVIYLSKKKCLSAIFRQLPQDTQAQKKVSRSAECKELSRRECEILRLIASGLTTKQAAERLYISEKTVQTHRSRIMQKLDIHKASDLVRYAMSAGLIDEYPLD